MLRLTKSDYDRILENFNRAYPYHLERGEYHLALRVVGISTLDVLVSAHEYTSLRWRSKLRKRVERFNFETKVKDTIRQL